MKRLDFLSVIYTGSNSENEEIFEKVISPSIIIELPDEEFYAKINPESGFKSVEGSFSGSTLTKLIMQWPKTKKPITSDVIT